MLLNPVYYLLVTSALLYVTHCFLAQLKFGIMSICISALLALTLTLLVSASPLKLDLEELDMSPSEQT